MAITVEDGTGLSNADAYISVSFADTHHTARGNTKWTDGSVTTANRETAIVRATDHIDKLFGKYFIGTRKREVQTLEWPRDDAWDRDRYLLNNEVPKLLQKACAEYALRAHLLNVLTPDPAAPVPSQSMIQGAANGSLGLTGEISRERIRVGPIEVDTTAKTMSDVQEGMPGNRSKSGLVTDALLPQYPEADLWIEELLRPGSVRQLLRV